MITEEDIDLLMQQYDYLVKKIANKYFILGADKDDLMQEGRFGLYKGLLSLDENKTDNKEAFLGLCIKRQIISAIKKSQTSKNKIMNNTCDIDECFEHISDPFNPLDKIISQENIDFIFSKIETNLSKLENSILKEFLQGQSYEEIGKKLNIKTKAVDSGLCRIRTKLKFLLKGLK